MAKYLYRYALESNNPTNNDDGNTWEDESRCLIMSLYISRKKTLIPGICLKNRNAVMYVWRDGDFENRLRF